MERRKKPDPKTIALGMRIRRLRERLGFTRAQLAELVGRHENTLGVYERGEKDMRAIDAPLLAAALRTSVATLLGETSEGLGLPRDRTEPVYVVSRDAVAQIKNAKHIKELKPLFVAGIESGFEISPEAEEVSAEEWGKVQELLDAKVAELGGIPRSW